MNVSITLWHQILAGIIVDLLLAFETHVIHQSIVFKRAVILQFVIVSRYIKCYLVNQNAKKYVIHQVQIYSIPVLLKAN